MCDSGEGEAPRACGALLALVTSRPREALTKPDGVAPLSTPSDSAFWIVPETVPALSISLCERITSCVILHSALIVVFRIRH
jgi:hypothetical protein